jgi:hypothetical protein
MTGGHDPFGDGRDLAWGLARAEYDLGKPLSNAAVMVDAGETEVFERRVAQKLKDPGLGGLRHYRPGLHLIKKGAQLGPGHNRKSLSHVDFKAS